MRGQGLRDGRPRAQRRRKPRTVFAVGRVSGLGSQAMSDTDSLSPQSNDVPMREPTDAPKRKPTVAIVFGGRSSEHAVSCATAAGVMQALNRDVYDVLPIGIAKDGRWVVASEDTGALELSPGHVPEVDGSGAAVLVPLSTCLL